MCGLECVCACVCVCSRVRARMYMSCMFGCLCVSCMFGCLCVRLCVQEGDYHGKERKRERRQWMYIMFTHHVACSISVSFIPSAVAASILHQKDGEV